MARYHEGRALMALGRLVEAEAAFLEVIARDTDATPYYAMWAEQQLTAVRAAMIGSCGANASCVLRPSYEPSERSAKPEGAASLRNGLGEGRLDAAAIRPTDLPATVESATLAERLAPIAAAHGDALPWLPRAEAFLRLGLRREAGQQLYEAFLAWREATGRPIRRCGLESVARGAERPRSFVSWQVKRDRRALTTDQRATLTEVAYAVGDVGAATGFGGWDEVQERPRAHARLVEEAAARHGLDPNLLFAVMRVESVYQTEIVSYAGAIGLAHNLLAAMLDNPGALAKRPLMAPGTFVFFNGKLSLHRVRPVGRTAKPRVIGLLSYDRRPDYVSEQPYIKYLSTLPRKPLR